MKQELCKLLLISCLFGSVQAKESFAVAEYRFGPDMSENMACELAEQKAKEKAIFNFFGEQIESITQKTCINEQCDFNDQVIVDVKGVITKINDYQRKIIKHEDFKSCLIKINAEVEKIQSNINFEVYGKVDYVYGEPIDLSFVASKPGYVYIFNYFYDSYKHVSDAQFYRPNTELKLHTLKAYLPKYLDFSKEMMVFLFTEKPLPNIRDKYAANEFKSMVSSVPVPSRKVVYRYMTIRRK